MQRTHSVLTFYGFLHSQSMIFQIEYVAFPAVRACCLWKADSRPFYFSVVFRGDFGPSSPLSTHKATGGISYFILAPKAVVGPLSRFYLYTNLGIGLRQNGAFFGRLRHSVSSTLDTLISHNVNKAQDQRPCAQPLKQSEESCSPEAGQRPKPHRQVQL